MYVRAQLRLLGRPKQARDAVTSQWLDRRLVFKDGQKCIYTPYMNV